MAALRTVCQRRRSFQSLALLGEADMEQRLITKKYESQLAKEFADLHSIRRDLNKTIEMLNLLAPEFEKPKEQQNSVLIEGLWSAGLVRYCRCYAEGKRTGLSTDIFSGLPGDPVGVHNWIKGMRDKLIAHSVNPFEECKTIISIDESDSPKTWGIGFMDVSYGHPDKEGMANIVGLCVVLRDKIKEQCEVLQKRLQGEVNTLSSEQLIELQDYQFTAPCSESAGVARQS